MHCAITELWERGEFVRRTINKTGKSQAIIYNNFILWHLKRFFKQFERYVSFTLIDNPIR